MLPRPQSFTVDRSRFGLNLRLLRAQSGGALASTEVPPLSVPPSSAPGDARSEPPLSQPSLCDLL